MDLLGRFRTYTKNVERISATQLIPENVLLFNDNSGIIEIEIDPIDLCNHDCYWCFTAEKRTTRKLDSKQLRKYLNIAAKNFPVNIIFSGGGEPLLYKDLLSSSDVFDNLSILDWCLRKKFNVGIITNGTYLDKLAFSHEISNIAFIRISLDSTDSDTHQKTHKSKKSEYSHIINNIKQLIKQRGTSFTPAIGISFIVDPNNKISYKSVDILNISNLARELGVDFVQIKHVHTDKSKAANELMQKIHSYCLDQNWGNSEFWVHKYIKPKPFNICKVTTKIQSIGGDNKKYPCCHLYGEENYLNQKEFTPEPMTLINCDSKVCRYASVNDVLIKDSQRDLQYQKLEENLIKFGFHPYRLNPTAPELFHPFKINL